MPLEFNPSLSPQVCFIASGRMHCSMNGLMHRKTVPEAIVAYVVHGSYEIECNGQREIIQEKELFLVPPDIPLEIIH